MPDEQIIDRGAIARRDSIRWRGKDGTACWGLADYTTDQFVRVEMGTGYKRRGYDIPWDRVTGHYPGPAEYNRRS